MCLKLFMSVGLHHKSPAAWRRTDAGLTGRCPLACRLAQALMQRCEASLRPHLQRFLTLAIQGQATQSELKQDWHTLILQVRWAGICINGLLHPCFHSPDMKIHQLFALQVASIFSNKTLNYDVISYIKEKTWNVGPVSGCSKDLKHWKQKKLAKQGALRSTGSKNFSWSRCTRAVLRRCCQCCPALRAS